MQQPPSVILEALQAGTAGLLQAAGLPGRFSLHPLPGGGNNQVFRVEANGARALLKAYFQHPEDRRDRLGAEYSFCAFAWGNGLRSLPQPLARDPKNRLGLYEFIEGRRPLPEEVGEDAIRQALAFFSEVNAHRRQPAAQELPAGSEAYFALADHLQCIERRLGVLREIQVTAEVDREALDFVGQQLAPAWGDVRGWVGGRAGALGLGLGREIPRDDRCLSPSDFGFHNSLLTPGGRLRFLDFEYSGWDDPAKMVCDFFCQVAMPLPESYFEWFVDAVASGLSERQQFRARVALLMPVYRLKWCCIILNEFVRVSSSRRQFANADGTREEKKAQQLRKARRVLRSVTDERGIYGAR
jgi:hypothetical protein